MACWLVAGAVAISNWLPAGAVAAAEPMDVNWSVGWEGVVKLGQWSLAVAEFTLEAPADCRLECTTPDGDGHQSSFVGQTVPLPAGRQRLETPFQVGRPDGAIELRLVTGDRVLQQTVIRPGDQAGALQLVPLSDRLYVSLGRVRSVVALGETATTSRVHVVSITDHQPLPRLPAGYASVDALLLSGPAAVSPAVSQAIREYVADGGRLIVSVPHTLEPFRASPLLEWLPVSIAPEPVSVRDLGGLEAYAGRNVRVPMTGRLSIADLSSRDGVALASSREEELLLRVPYGFGEVQILALDLTQPPLANWGAVNDLVRRLVHEDSTAAAQEKSRVTGSRGQLTSTGISDLASQLGACLDGFAAVQRPRPWWSMIWLLACLIVVGPLDYLVVHRVLRRPHYTWVTLPLLLALFATLSARAGGTWNQHAPLLNQLDVVDIDAATSTLRWKSFATYYSPRTARIDLTASPRSDAGLTVGMPTDQAAARGLSWFYIPESTTGGLYRPGGVEWGRTGYEIEPLAHRMTRLPVLQWSSRTVAAGWSGTARNAIDGELQSTGLGRLTGTLTHHLPGRLTDWVLAYGNRAYWLQPSRTDNAIAPWPAERRLSLEDPLMFQGDLRGLLTRIVTTREAGQEAKDTRIRLEQTRYDPTARDLHRLWQMTTFHQAAGGSGYTGLANQWLANDDLSRQLELGRAVLFGRLSSPVWTELQIGDAPLAPDQSEVFVRLVLPVRSSGEIVRELPRFDKDGDKSKP